MTIELSAINWVAVVLATLAYFVLGAVWFAPQTPIGRAWVAASGYTSPTSGPLAGNAFYLIPLITCLVAVVATALVAGATGTDTIGEALVLGLVVGIGYAATVTLSTAAFEFSKPKPWVFGVIDASYHVVGLLIAAVIVAVVR